jgi:hypothetical protein
MSGLHGKRAKATREFIDAYRKFRKGVDLTGKDLARFSRLVAYANANGDKAPAFMAKNDRADIPAILEGDAELSPRDWKRLSSSERAAVEAAARASRGLFTEVAEANVRAGLLRRYALGKKVEGAAANGETIDVRRPGIDDGGVTTTEAQAQQSAAALRGQDKLEGIPEVPQVGVRYELRARTDSPENLTPQDFIKAIRKGNLRRGANQIRPNITPRAGDFGEFDLLKTTDELLNEGYSAHDLARNLAHEWAMSRDADYRKKFNEWAQDQFFRKYASQRLTPAVKKKLLDQSFQGDQAAMDTFLKALEKFKKKAPIKEKRQPKITNEMAEKAHAELLQQKADYSSSPRAEIGDITEPSADFPEEATLKLDPSKGDLVAQKAKANQEVDEFLNQRVKDGKTNFDPSDFVEPESYFKHVYRPERLVHEESEFIRLEAQAWLRNWEKVNNRSQTELKGAARVAIIRSALAHAKGAHRAIVHGVDSEGQRAGGSYRSNSNLRGSVIERNVFMDSRDLLRRGWIEDDVLHLMERAVRQNGTDAILATRFRRQPTIQEINRAMKRDADAYWIDGDDPTTVPDLAMTEPKRLLQAEIEEKIRLAKTDEERTAILGEGKQMQDLIDTSTDILRGRYLGDDQGSPYGRKMAMVRDATFAAKMGNILINSMPDAPLQILEHGVGRVARYAVGRASARVGELFNGADEKTVLRIRREARAAGVAIETENMTRVASGMDTSDPFNAYARSSPTERFFKSVAFGASRAFGIVYWNNMNQRIGYGIFSDRVAQIAMDRSVASAADKRWLAKLGIGDKEFLDAVRKNMLGQSDGGSERGGLFYPEPSSWDRQTRERFYAASRDSNRQTIISPELLEKPLNLHGPTGATMLQFTGYVFASTLRVTAQTAARLKLGDASERANISVAIAGMLAASALSIYLRFLSADRLADLPDWESNKGWWMYEIADRAGFMGLFSHIANVAESVGGPGPRKVLQSVMGDSGTGRIGSTAKSLPREPASAILGPLALTLKDATNVGFDLTGSAVNQVIDAPNLQRVDGGTVKSVMRLAPIVNGAQFRSFITNPTEKYISEELLGVPYDSR